MFSHRKSGIYSFLLSLCVHTYILGENRENKYALCSENVAGEKYLMLKMKEEKMKKILAHTHQHIYYSFSLCTKTGWKLFKSRWVIFSFEGIQDRREKQSGAKNENNQKKNRARKRDGKICGAQHTTHTDSLRNSQIYESWF